MHVRNATGHFRSPRLAGIGNMIDPTSGSLSLRGLFLLNLSEIPQGNNFGLDKRPINIFLCVYHEDPLLLARFLGFGVARHDIYRQRGVRIEYYGFRAHILAPNT